MKTKYVKPIRTFIAKDGSWNIEFKPKDVKRILKYIKKQDEN